MAGIAYNEDEELNAWEEQQQPQQQNRRLNLPLATEYGGSFIRKTTGSPADGPQEGHAKQWLASLGIGIASLFSECILTHPCIVIRRQCQVHRMATRYHITPFSLLAVVVNLQKRQGLSTLWKGLGSVFILRGITLGVEDLLSKITSLPKEVSRHNSMRTIGKHLLLKSLSFMVVTPFFSSSLVETVQSDIASETPGIFDCIKEGIKRLVSTRMSATCRVVPVWLLLAPTVILGVAQYVVSSSVQFIALRTLRLKEVERHNSEQTRYGYSLSTAENCLLELSAAFVGHFFSDVLLYPLETVVYRLHVQGTRTIIDNLDTGCEVIPLITRYDGVVDCFNGVIRDEGVSGLYKGFGALLLQFAIRLSILRLTKFIYRELHQKTN
uniref:Solute carrier family 25 member 46 n=1 Tax=Strigamia maritima TaxID=126957 RepID=T1JFS1_STRMM